MIKTVMIGAAAAFAMAGQAVANPSPHEVFGVWRTQSGEVDVLIAKDAEGAPCGRVVKEEGGETKLGRPFLYAFEKGEEAWVSGTVRDRRSGRTYRAQLSRAGSESLTLEGCFGPFCRAQNWFLQRAGTDGFESDPVCEPES